jgi:phosphomannomutase
MLEPKTRIGSPYVIEGMQRAAEKGKRAICGWEANGGFLTGSDIDLDGNVLTALPTRDAVLPILCSLFTAQERNRSLVETYAQLPKRYSRASLIKQFPRPSSLKIVQHFSPADERIKDVNFQNDGVRLSDENGNELPGLTAELQRMSGIRSELERLFSTEFGFSGIARLNYIDGVRIIFSNEDVAHVRPSGNADELRIYAVADTQARADEIVRAGVAEPAGILRRMEKFVISEMTKLPRHVE